MRRFEDDLRLIALKSIDGLGEKVNEHLKELRHSNSDYIVPIEETRFQNGEGKIKILDTIRNKDVYILTDVGNHSITYPIYGHENHKSPDDHYQDVKRTLYAIRSHSSANSIIMPLLYSSRQHRRQGRESLDCANALQDFISLGVKNIITFDVHDPNIQNAIPNSSFESFFPTREIIESFLENEDIDFRNMHIVSPDAGAVGRANLLANLFKCDMGMFRKVRDTTVVKDGKNPIIGHAYVGSSLEGKNVIIADDMISSGESMIKTAKQVKELGAEKVYLIATFAMFTEGIKPFKEGYENGYFDKVYTTNLTYFNPEYEKEPWLEKVDCSFKVAQIINSLNEGHSLTPLLNDNDKTSKAVQRKIAKM